MAIFGSAAPVGQPGGLRKFINVCFVADRAGAGWTRGLLCLQAVVNQVQLFAQLVKYPCEPHWRQVDGGPWSLVFARPLIGRQGWHHGRPQRQQILVEDL